MTSTTLSGNLRMYVNDMVALEKNILDAVDKQCADPRVQEDPACSQLVREIHAGAKGRLADMENHAAAIGGEPGATIKEAVAGVAGTLAGIYDMVRKHPVSRMLRDDYTALSLATTSYSMLYTTALAIHDQPVARVALRHLQEIPKQVMALSQLIPRIVVRELAEDDSSVDTSVIPLAQEKTLEAWGAAK
jgi:ferritin-like metal-binding protein YciE